MQLNPEQQQAVNEKCPNLLILAGAGSGKTRTLVHKAISLLENGVLPEQIALLTFTRKSTEEMRSRILKAVPDAERLFINTFHSFCLRIMQSNRQPFGLKNIRLLDREDQLELFKAARVEVGQDTDRLPKAAELIKLYSYARNTNQGVELYLEKFTNLSEELKADIKLIFKHYQQKKQQNDYLDFDDLLYKFATTLQQNSNFRQYLKRKFSHFLVDEMQDTNPLQWLILQQLANPAHLFCVGDDAQSIYSFRGADFQNVHRFKERLENAKVLKLNQNYRSTQAILDLANWILEKSKLNYAKKLFSTREPGQKPRLIDFYDDRDEARWIVQDLLDHKSDLNGWKDFMLLTRTALGARLVEALLIEKNIPYRFIGGTSLLNTAHVKDALALCRAALSTTDELAWFRFLKMLPKVGHKTARKIYQQILELESGPESGLESAQQIISFLQNKHPQAAACLARLQPKLSSPPAVLEAATLCLEQVLRCKYDNWERRKRDLALLALMFKKHPSLEQALTTYSLEPPHSTDASHYKDALTLITIHSAKGTEARYCYLIQAQPGMHPHGRSIGDEAQEEEERRILYVAVTRAQDKLTITRNCSRYTDKEASIPENQYFLEDVPEELVRYQMVSKFRKGIF